MRTVIAQSPAQEAFVIEYDDGQVRVLDLRQSRLWDKTAKAIILSRGSWESFEGDQDSVLELADRVAATEKAAD